MKVGSFFSVLSQNATLNSMRNSNLDPNRKGIGRKHGEVAVCTQFRWQPYASVLVLYKPSIVFKVGTSWMHYFCNCSISLK